MKLATKGEHQYWYVKAATSKNDISPIINIFFHFVLILIRIFVSSFFDELRKRKFDSIFIELISIYLKNILILSKQSFNLKKQKNNKITAFRTNL